MRRIRASMLLRCVVLGWSIALILALVALAPSAGWTAGTVLLAALVWVVGIELDLLPIVIARLAARRARRSGRTSSAWFVDDEERRRNANDLHDHTRDNPTVR